MAKRYYTPAGTKVGSLSSKNKDKSDSKPKSSSSKKSSSSSSSSKPNYSSIRSRQDELASQGIARDLAYQIARTESEGGSLTNLPADVAEKVKSGKVSSSAISGRAVEQSLSFKRDSTGGKVAERAKTEGGFRLSGQGAESAGGLVKPPESARLRRPETRTRTVTTPLTGPTMGSRSPFPTTTEPVKEPIPGFVPVAESPVVDTQLPIGESVFGPVYAPEKTDVFETSLKGPGAFLSTVLQTGVEQYESKEEAKQFLKNIVQEELEKESQIKKILPLEKREELAKTVEEYNKQISDYNREAAEYERILNTRGADSIGAQGKAQELRDTYFKIQEKTPVVQSNLKLLESEEQKVNEIISQTSKENILEKSQQLESFLETPEGSKLKGAIYYNEVGDLVIDREKISDEAIDSTGFKKEVLVAALKSKFTPYEKSKRDLEKQLVSSTDLFKSQEDSGSLTLREATEEEKTAGTILGKFGESFKQSYGSTVLGLSTGKDVEPIQDPRIKTYSAVDESGRIGSFLGTLAGISTFPVAGKVLSGVEGVIQGGRLATVSGAQTLTSGIPVLGKVSPFVADLGIQLGTSAAIYKGTKEYLDLAEPLEQKQALNKLSVSGKEVIDDAINYGMSQEREYLGEEGLIKDREGIAGIGVNIADAATKYGYDFVPLIGNEKSNEVFVDSAKEYLKSQGFSEADANKYAEIALQDKYDRGIASLTTLIQLESMGNIRGGESFTKLSSSPAFQSKLQKAQTLFVSKAPNKFKDLVAKAADPKKLTKALSSVGAGYIEGSTQYAAPRLAEGDLTSEEAIKAYGVYGPLGGLSAASAQYGLATLEGSKTGSKILESALDIADLGEAPGDIYTSLYGGPAYQKIVSFSGAPSISEVSSPSPITDSSLSTGVPIIQSTESKSLDIASESPIKSMQASETIQPFGTVDTFTSSEVPVLSTEFTRVDTRTSSEVPAITEVPATTDVQSQTQVDTSTRTFTPQGGLGLLPFGALGAGAAARGFGRGGSARQIENQIRDVAGEFFKKKRNLQFKAQQNGINTDIANMIGTDAGLPNAAMRNSRAPFVSARANAKAGKNNQRVPMNTQGQVRMPRYSSRIPVSMYGMNDFYRRYVSPDEMIPQRMNNMNSSQNLGLSLGISNKNPMFNDKLKSWSMNKDISKLI